MNEQNKDCIIRAHTERSLEPKSGVKSDNISTWVFNMQIWEPICITDKMRDMKMVIVPEENVRTGKTQRFLRLNLVLLFLACPKDM